MFIIITGLLLGQEYGTRSSTTIVVELDGKVSVLERTWHSGKDRWFRFDSKGGSADKLEGILVSHSRYVKIRDNYMKLFEMQGKQVATPWIASQQSRCRGANQRLQQP